MILNLDIRLNFLNNINNNDIFNKIRNYSNIVTELFNETFLSKYYLKNLNTKKHKGNSTKLGFRPIF